jgi:predicted kinase
MKMTLTRGLPGSGKTTWAFKEAAKTGAVLFSRDDFRAMLFGKYVLDADGETAVTIAQHGAIEAALKFGTKDVIVHDTNLNVRSVKELMKLAQKYDVEVVFKDFLGLSVDECADRVAGRVEDGGRDVPYKVIKGMFDRYIKGRTQLPEIILPTYDIKPYVISPDTNIFSYNGKPWAIIVDLDGTVAKMAGRSPYDWARVGEDSPVQDVLAMVRSMNMSGYKVLFTSGRDGSCREITEAWIEKHASVRGWELLMRKAKDNRPDWIVKAEIFDKYIRDNYNVRCVFDDRDQVVRMWRKMGLTVAQVAEGEF